MAQTESTFCARFPLLDPRKSKGAVAYYCTACAKILAITRFPLSPEAVKRNHPDLCPECSRSLATNLAWRAIDGKHLVTMLTNDAEFQAAYCGIAPKTERKPEIEFKRATSLFGLSFRENSLEALFQGLKKGRVVVFYGSTFCHLLSEELCCRTQLPLEKGGFHSPAVFIDGGNRFDPYAITSFARYYDLDPKTTLQNIRVSRAFTCYQLATLILEELPKVLAETGSHFVVVSDFLNLFDAADVERIDAEDLLREITLTARKLCQERSIIFLLTCLRRRPELEARIFSQADVLASFEEKNHHVQVSVSKQIAGRSTTVSIPVHRTRSQRTLHRVAPEIVSYG